MIYFWDRPYIPITTGRISKLKLANKGGISYYIKKILSYLLSKLNYILYLLILSDLVGNYYPTGFT